MKPCPATVQLKYYVRHIYNFNIFSSHTVKRKKTKIWVQKLISIYLIYPNISKYYFNMGINAKQLHNSFSS